MGDASLSHVSDAGRIQALYDLRTEHSEMARKDGELPKVSVLIPAHNEEVVIRQTLKAMVNLYYPKDRLEIIVVNDNSSDRTGDIVNEFSRQYDFIKMVITKPPNAGKGKSSALNSGFAESNGDVICVYDADNTPEKWRCTTWFSV